MNAVIEQDEDRADVWDAPRSEPDHLVEKALADWRQTTADIRQLAAELGLSKSECSRRSDVAMGTLSPWYDGSYNGNFPNVTARVRKWLAAERGKRSIGVSQLVEPGFVETPTAREVVNALIYAQTAPAMVVITLGAGMGKTTVARHIADTRPHAYRIVMRPSTGSTHSMLRELARQLGVVERDPGKLGPAIGEKLKRNGRHTLIMLDEAQNLSDAAVNELRHFLDEYGCGIALLGNEEVSTRWGRAEPREGQAQVHRRIGMRIRRLSPKQADIDVFVDAWGLADAEAVKLARAIGRKPGALGQVTESLKIASVMASARGTALTVKDLADAWRNRGGEDLGR